MQRISASRRPRVAGQCAPRQKSGRRHSASIRARAGPWCQSCGARDRHRPLPASRCPAQRFGVDLGNADSRVLLGVFFVEHPLKHHSKILHELVGRARRGRSLVPAALNILLTESGIGKFARGLAIAVQNAALVCFRQFVILPSVSGRFRRARKMVSSEPLGPHTRRMIEAPRRGGASCGFEAKN
jgi:hypothetical protein